MRLRQSIPNALQPFLAPGIVERTDINNVFAICTEAVAPLF